MIRALVFDFDGLILDTETPELRAWQQMYREHGSELPIKVWADCIGRPHGYFDPYAYLEELSGRPVDRETMRIRRRAVSRGLLAKEGPMPGVEIYLRQARELGLKAAVASSSTTEWVRGHLDRLGLSQWFDSFTCAEHTTTHKPDPEPYLCALRSLGVAASEAFALEDSPNGVKSAKAAGLYCVAVPNPVTGMLDLSEADLVLPSLEALTLVDLVNQIESS